ncbi:MAG: twin-arginine translocation signal domain-containing protein, partial [Candidatus Nanohaloarchaea archaeon]
MTEGSEEKGFGDLDVSPEAAEKLNEAMKERLDGRVEELLGERETDSGEEVSRRSFIKKLGLGAMGVGLASLIPSGSAYNIRSSDGLEVWGNGTKYFDVNPSGPVEVKNADLRLATGQFIEDGGGTNRLELNES